METVLTDIDSVFSPEHCIIYILVAEGGGGGSRRARMSNAEPPNVGTPYLEQTGYKV